MDTLQQLSKIGSRYWPDVVLAIVFAVIVDLARVGSHIRSGARHVKNRISEQSVERLRKRIAELERYRDTLGLYMSSDKALYLGILRFVVGILLCMCAGMMLLVLGGLGMAPHAYLVALLFFALSMAIGAQGLRIASLDTGANLSKMIRKIDEDISALKAKLPARTQ